uniref:Phosphatidic acid phosphatase type 2/haloperoxidase domain-containing protein n=1 Tax=viral metagenome TaxID=1070528 RepID=A0A6C0CQB5_9ZZZZ
MWKVLSVLGAFGPWVMAAVIVTENIIDQCSYFKVGALILWQPLSITINGLLKEIINQDRPPGTRHVNELEKLIDEGTKGMPSGHAQLVGSELMLSVLSNTSDTTRYIMIGQTFLTLYQRWLYKKHTIMQLLIGFFIGIFYSTVFWFGLITFI